MKISKSELKFFRSLSQKKVRQTEKKYLLEGWRALKEALQASAKIEMVGVHSRYLEDPDYGKILDEVRKRKISIKELTEKEIRQASETVHAQGVLAVVRQKATKLSEDFFQKSHLVVAADAVSDPGNLGSIVRTADWFGVDFLLLGKGCVDLYNDKVVRSTVGSLFHLPIVENVDLPSVLKDLRGKGFDVIALSADGTASYDQIPQGRRMAVVLGNEAHGVSREVRAVADQTVRIPRFGNAESLNVGVACGIVLAHVKEEAQTATRSME